MLLSKLALSKKLEEAMNERKFWLLPNSPARLALELVHFLLILYSAFALTIYVCFKRDLSGFPIVMEFVCLFEWIIYSICQLRIAQYESGTLTLEFKNSLRHYWEDGLLYELIGQFPMNIIYRKLLFGLV